MAWDPCVSCGRAFHGPTEFTYVTWHRGEIRYAYRLRQCTECSSELRNGVSGTADVKDAAGGWVPLTPRTDQVAAEGDRAQLPPGPVQPNGRHR